MANQQSDFVFLPELFAQKSTFEAWRPLVGPPSPAGGLEFCCLSLNDSWVHPLFTCHLNIFRFILRSYCLLTDRVMGLSPSAWLNYLKPVRAGSLCYPPSWRVQMLNVSVLQHLFIRKIPFLPWFLNCNRLFCMWGKSSYDTVNCLFLILGIKRQNKSLHLLHNRL